MSGKSLIIQDGDSPAQRGGSPSLASAISPENPIYQGALAGTDYTARDASTQNDSATPRADTGNIRGIRSPDVPAEFEVGKTYRMRHGGTARIDRISGEHLIGWNNAARGEYSWWRTGEGGHRGLFGPYDLMPGAISAIKLTPLESAQLVSRITNEGADAIEAEVDRRLSASLFDAGRSALGMPGTVDTFKAMLAKAGLTLVLA